MADTIDRLEIQVETQAQKANSELDKLINRLERVSTSLSGINAFGLKGLSNGIASLSASMQRMNEVKTTDFTRLAKNIEKLGNIDQASINNTASAIRTISSALTASTGLSSGAAQITDLANSISRLGYKSASNAIKNIPMMADALKGLMKTLSTSPNVSKNLIDMTNALANLASQGSKVRSATNGIDKSLKSYSGRAREATSSTRAFTISLASLYAKLWAIRRIASTAFKSTEKSMDYVETINLFQTSFKKIGVDTAEDLGMKMGSVASEQFAKGFIDRAQSFNDKITSSLSLDPDLMMNYQAVFAQMANSMNLTSESAMNISESFTLLGNDIASLWNIKTDAAMKKLQSGLAGQIRPLRELGIDISKTSLQMYALKYGITDSYEKMSQAAKVQLRWLAIMEQSEVAFGDMSKTISSPSNQLRILQQQWTNLTRSIGNVFLPVVSTVLPYINALVIALRRMVDTFATAVGFELPDYSDSNIYTDVTGDIEGIGDAADKTTDSVNSMKKALAKFDELNVLSKNKDKGIKLDTGSGYKKLDDAINKKTVSYMQKFNEELANMQNKAEELADRIQPKLEKFVTWMDKIAPILVGIGAAFITYKVIGWFESLATALGALNPTTGVVALAVGAITAIYLAVKKYNKKLIEEDLASRFGDITLSLEEIEDIAERLTASKYTANIDIYITEKNKLKDLEKNIEKDIEILNKLNWKVSVGLELTEGEIEQYESTIEQFISDSEAYIEQQHYVTTLAINAVIQDEDFKTEIQQLVDEYFNGSKGEMERLGKQLRSEMDKALADGVLDAEEKKVIDNLIKEIAEVQERVSNAEFKAKLQMITIDGELSPDSFKDLTKKIQEIIGERTKQAEEASYTMLAAVNTSYSVKMEHATTPAEKEAIQQEWDKTVDEITSNLSKTKAIITLEGAEFSLDTLTKNYETELSKVIPKFATSTKETLEPAVANEIKNMDTTQAMGTLANSMVENYKTAIANSGMSSTAKKGLQQMLDTLEPTREQLQKIYEDAVNTGKQVPDGVSAALTDLANLGALTGNMDDIAFLIGQKLSTDPTYLELLDKSENAGATLDSHLIAGLKSGIPDLKIQGDDLIFDLQAAISNASSADNTQSNLSTAGKNIVDGVNKGIENNADSTEKPVKSWASKIKDWFKNLFDIHSPSGVSEKWGKNIVEGLNKGIANNQDSSKSFVQTWASKISTWFKNLFDINSPSGVSEKWGKNIVDGLNVGISNNQSSSKGYVNTWANSIKTWFTDLFNIHSPSVVAADWGKNIVKGFNKGISANAGTSKRYMQKWADSIGDMNASMGLSMTYSSVQGYAGGGQPNTGELFMARENGIPELVGTMGGKTTVANNNDISAGIEEAAYRGMTRALFEADGKGNINLNVTLKGEAKGLFEVVKEQAEEYYDITNTSPFPI